MQGPRDAPPRYYAGPVVPAAVTRRFYLYHQVLPSIYQPTYMDGSEGAERPLSYRNCDDRWIEMGLAASRYSCAPEVGAPSLPGA